MSSDLHACKEVRTTILSIRGHGVMDGGRGALRSRAGHYYYPLAALPVLPAPLRVEEPGMMEVSKEPKQAAASEQAAAEAAAAVAAAAAAEDDGREEPTQYYGTCVGLPAANIGSIVVLHGLSAAAHLNGAQGVIESFRCPSPTHPPKSPPTHLTTDEPSTGAQIVACRDRRPGLAVAGRSARHRSGQRGAD